MFLNILFLIQTTVSYRCIFSLLFSSLSKVKNEVLLSINQSIDRSIDQSINQSLFSILYRWCSALKKLKSSKHFLALFRGLLVSVLKSPIIVLFTGPLTGCGKKKKIVRVLGDKLCAEKRRLCGNCAGLRNRVNSQILVYMQLQGPPKKNLTRKKFWINEKDNYCFLTLAINVNQHSPFCDYFGQS